MIKLSVFPQAGCGNKNTQPKLITSTPSPRDHLWLRYSCGTGLVCAETFASLLMIADEEEEEREEEDNTICDEETVELSTILYSLIRWRRWDAALERLNQCPQEASTWIVTGTGIEQNQSNNTTTTTTTMTNSKYLPLHLVCKETTRQYRLIRELLHVYPEAVRAQDPMGRLPLHLFCLAVTDNPTLFCSQNNVDSVRNSLHLLLELYPESMYVQDCTQSTPLSIITDAVHRKGRAALTEVIIASVETLAIYHSQQPNPPTTTVEFPPNLPVFIKPQHHQHHPIDFTCSCNEQPLCYNCSQSKSATRDMEQQRDVATNMSSLFFQDSSEDCDNNFINDTMIPSSPTSTIVCFTADGAMHKEMGYAPSDEQSHKEEEVQHLQIPSVDDDDATPYPKQLDKGSNNNNEIASSQQECNVTLPTCLSTSTITSNPCQQDFLENNKPTSFDNCSYNNHMLLHPSNTSPNTNYEDISISEEEKTCTLDTLDTQPQVEEATQNNEVLMEHSNIPLTVEDFKTHNKEEEVNFLQSKIIELEVAYRELNVKLQILNSRNQSGHEEVGRILS